jgi:hypothetical protein
VLINLTGALLLVAGSFGLLGVPVVAMFSEGIPDSWSDNQGGYLALWAAVSVTFIVAAFGIDRRREWGRLLGIATYIYVALDPGSRVVSFISMAFALVLVFAWRPRVRQPGPSSNSYVGDIQKGLGGD